ncbi:MAG: hypothetical protein ACWA5P_01760 [bacterium]
MKKIKRILNHLDQYGYEILLRELKNQFSTVTWKKKYNTKYTSWPLAKVRSIKEDLKILKPIFHRNGDLTIITSQGVMKYTRDDK